MASQTLQFKHVFDGRRLEREEQAGGPRLCREELVGRLVELSGQGASALLTLGVGLVLEAQRASEPSAWVSVGEHGIFPPDLWRAGVDLEALAVIRAQDTIRAVQASIRLAQSGAFGLIVLDLSRESKHGHPQRAGPRVPPAGMSRLVGLAQKHEMVVVFLTQKDAEQGSLDSLISLRGEVTRGESLGAGRFRCVLDVLKDKRRGPHWSHEVECVGPAGIW